MLLTEGQSLTSTVFNLLVWHRQNDVLAFMLTEIVVPLLSLVALEVVLGIDNVIFISILADRLPDKQRASLRYWGLGLAMLMRLVLLYFIAWILKLDNTLLNLLGRDLSGKDLILIGGGLFLLFKSSKEIYHKTEHARNPVKENTGQATFGRLLVEVLVLDLVFSVDSIITAVGMVSELWIMYTAVIITVGIMALAAGPISRFIQKHPSFKVLALSFLLVIGFSLLAEGMGIHIPKGYIYFSMAFAFMVDVLQVLTIPKVKS
jgi:predicted tellurium resistance membrane protein TerC